MREIKFKGCRLDTFPRQKWIVGYVINQEVTSCDILSLNHKAIFTVAVESVGQFTGLKDWINQDIYEGDIIKDNCDKTYVVQMLSGHWVGNSTLVKDESEYLDRIVNLNGARVIGNKYDEKIEEMVNAYKCLNKEQAKEYMYDLKEKVKNGY